MSRATVTFAEIKAAVDLLEEVVKDWESAPRDQVAIVHWRGNDRRAVSVEIESAANELFELVNQADEEFENSHDCHALVLAIDDFDDAFCKWAEACQRTPDRTDPGGGPEVWEPYNRMLAAREQRAYARPEPIGALLAQKVSHQQIAKIYGWRDPSGAPDLVKVQEEITSPGTHFKADKWVHPALRRIIADVADRWAKREAKQQRPGRKPSAPEPKVQREAPESLDELIYGGVNVLQIAKMKRITPDQVRERAADLGVPLDGSVLSAAAARARRPSPTEDEEEISRKAEELRLLGANDHADLGDNKEARVLAIAADGREPRDIVKILANAFPGLTYQKVTRIIEQAKVDQGKLATAAK